MTVAAGRRVDLGKIEGEARRESVEVVVGGETFEGPPELSYRAARPFLGMSGKDPGEVDGDDVVGAIDGLMAEVIGAENWARLGGDLPLGQVLAGIGALIAEYGYADVDATTDDALGESRASARS